MKSKVNNAKYLFTYAWNKCKPLFFTTSAKYIFSAFLPLINIIGIGAVVDALIQGSNRAQVTKIILLYLGINLCISILKTGITYFNNIVTRKASDITQLDYMSDCIFINYHYVEDGSILDLKNKSIRAHPVWFIDSTFNLLLYILQFGGIFYLFITLKPWFLLFIGLTSSISIFLNFQKQKFDYNFQNAQINANRKLDYLFYTMSDYKYAKEIRINLVDRFISGKYASLMKKQMSELGILSHQNLSVNLLVTVITVLQTVLIYAYFSYQVSKGRIGIAEYTVLLGATTLLASGLFGFFDLIGKIDKTLSYTDLFRAYRDKVKEYSNISSGEYSNPPMIHWDTVEIEFSHVTFSYPGSNKNILEDVCFKIESGEKIGIVGLNGSGKTTLIKLLCRLYDPTSGRILVNGVDIRTIPHGEYIRKLGIVLQDFCLFAYSIKENIVFDSEVHEDHVEKVIEKSGLSGKISGLENGVHTFLYKTLNDCGIEVSGGEGQRLALARAMYKAPCVMILDEPTSTLDPLAEYKLFSKLSEIANDKTTLFISHRLSSTRFCDRIFVMANKGIAECGSHDELMEQNGIYASLFASQAKYYERAVNKE